jgi:hypothetical protein
LLFVGFAEQSVVRVHQHTGEPKDYISCMPPRRRELPAAEKAAHQLTVLLQDRAVRHLLQQPAPAAALRPQQAGPVLRCCSVLESLSAALVEKAAAQQAVPALLSRQAVYRAGVLLAWTQQQPQQLATVQVADTWNDICNGRTPPTLASLWLFSWQVLSVVMQAILVGDDDITASGLAQGTLEQLEQSGWAMQSIMIERDMTQQQLTMLIWSNLKAFQSSLVTVLHGLQIISQSTAWEMQLQRVMASGYETWGADLAKKNTEVCAAHPVLLCLQIAGALGSLTAILQPLALFSNAKLADNSARTVQKSAFGTVRQVVAMCDLLVKHQPLQVPVVVRALLPLLQQLQQCGPLLQPAPRETAAAVEADGASSSTASSSAASRILEMPRAVAYYEAQREVTMVLYTLCSLEDLPPDSAAAVCDLLRHPSAAELLLQVLAASTTHLHSGQTAHKQQQQKQQRRLRQKNSNAGSSSSSSSSNRSSSTGSATVCDQGRNRVQQRRQPRRHQPYEAELLPIPDLHQDLLPLLPCGDAYLSGAAELVRFEDEEGVRFSLPTAAWCADALAVIVTPRCRQQAVDSTGVWQPPPAPPSADVPAQSPSAIQLSLQLQLVAASLVQRQRQEAQQQHAEEQPQKQQQQQQQQGRETSKEKRDWACLLASSNALLQMQIRAVLQSGSSCLPQGLLQKAGLQLLLAVSAPVQQQISSSTSSSSSPTTGTQHKEAGEDTAGQAMFALRAAACGLAQTSSKQWPPGCYHHSWHLLPC